MRATFYVFFSVLLFLPVINAEAEWISDSTIAPESFYRFLDAGVPELPLRKALEELESNSERYPRKDYIGIVDFRMPSTAKRLFILDLLRSTVASYYVAHGKNSGENYANQFSNVSGSNKSSIGAYRAAEVYYGSHGRSMRFDGMDATNSNARERLIVLHGATYVSEDFIAENGRLGRSLGCPAVENQYVSMIIDQLHSGSLFYAYYNQ